MTSRRIAKVAQAMRETISSCILRGLKDPRVRDVTVLNVDVSDDTRTAKVYVSVMGDERTQALCLHGLNSARGYLQRKVADRVQTRYTPVLTFVLDSSVKRSVATSRILREIAAEKALNEGRETPDSEESLRETEAGGQTDATSQPQQDGVTADMPQTEAGDREDSLEIEARPDDSS